MRLTILIILALVLFSLSVTRADTIHIPADYPTIQAGIDAAMNGDTVLVAPGTYPENIDFIGKAIAVESSEGPESTIIDGGQAGSVVAFQTGEVASSVLSGFAVANGTGTDIEMKPGVWWKIGGGIFCDGTSPTIRCNHLIQNISASGGGICCYNGSSPIIFNNRIIGNTGMNHGGGICCLEDSAPIISNNIISENQAFDGGGIHLSQDPVIIQYNWIHNNHVGYDGGGIWCRASDSTIMGNMITSNYAGRNGGGIDFFGAGPSPRFTNNTVTQNGCGNWGGGIHVWICSPDITNCIIWDDFNDLLNDAAVNFCDVPGGWPGTGNISADPLFADPANNDFHLTYNSPCRDTGDNSVITEPTDFEGDPRIAWGGAVDMGADEFYTHLYITGDKTPSGYIQGKFVGLPGTSPVGLFLGSGIRPRPIPTEYGDFWLLPPRRLIPLIPIPANGILVIPATIPMSPHAPYDIPMQGLVGLNPDSLTNLCVLEVR